MVEKKRIAQKDSEKTAKDLLVSKSMIAYRQFLNHLGELLIAYGNLEKESGKSLEEVMMYLTAHPQRFLDDIKESAGEEARDLFIKIFFELTTLGPVLDNMYQLSADKKIEAGNRLHRVSEMFGKLLEYTPKAGKKND